MSLQHIDAAIRKLSGEHPESRPFLCEGSPLDCVVAQVGINPGSDTPFWPHWRVETGCDKQGWLRDYRFRKAGKRTPTRDRIELLNEVLRPYKVLELNLYHQFSASEASLAADHKSTELFEYMLDAVRPRLLFVHGRAPREHLERLLGTQLKTNDFTTKTHRGQAIDIFVATKHLAYVAGGEAYVREVGGRIKRRLQEISGGSRAPAAQVTSESDRPSPGKSAAIGTYSLASLREQYSVRKVALSETAVAAVIAEGKYCSRCHRQLPAHAFPPSPQSASGLRSACRECLRKRK
jgi:hypothetical protein